MPETAGSSEQLSGLELSTHDHIAGRVAGDAGAHVAVAISWCICGRTAPQLLDELQGQAQTEGQHMHHAHYRIGFRRGSRPDC